MKRYITIMLSMLLMLSVIIPSEVKAEDSIKVYIDGELIDFSVDPIIKNGTTLVPFRTIFEELDMIVDWNPTTRKVTGKKNGLIIDLFIGDKKAYVNGKSITLSVAPEVVKGSTMVPLRFLGEASGQKVEWDGNNKTVLIATNKDPNFRLFNAIMGHDLEKVVESLNAGADPNNTEFHGHSYLGWIMPYMWYTEPDYTNHINMVKALLEAGADPNAIDEQGGSVMYQAISHGSVETVKLLIDYGADLNAGSSTGATPLEYAREKSRLYTDLDESSRQNLELIISFLENPDQNITSLVKIESIKDLENYYNKAYSALDTPMGIWRFEYKIDKNTSSIFRHDYWIQVDWSGCSPYEIEYSIEYTNEEKGETIELLKNFQEDIAKIAFSYFPDKKFTGGFYSSYYKYPNLKVGYNSIRFLTWVNYTNTVLLDYYEANITQFHWDSFIDDYVF